MSGRSEHVRGAALVLALHVGFTALTVLLAYTLPLQEFQPRELIEPWMLYLGLLQGIYVVPAALTVALMQRWQLLIGIGIAAGLTAAATLVALALG